MENVAKMSCAAAAPALPFTNGLPNWVPCPRLCVGMVGTLPYQEGIAQRQIASTEGRPVRLGPVVMSGVRQVGDLT